MKTDKATRSPTQAPVAPGGALQDAHALLQAFVRASPLAVAILDPKGIIRLWNPAAERMLGWTEREIVGRPIPYVPSGDEDRRRRKQILSGAVIAELEVRRPRKDGSPIDLSVSAFPIRDTFDRLVGVVVMAADITERKQMQESIRQSAAHLETLNRVIASASSATDLAQLLEIALQETVRTLGCTIGGISAEGTLMTHGLAPDAAATLEHALAENGSRFPEPARIDDWSTAGGSAAKALAPVMAKVGIRASLNVPIEADGRVIGGLAVASPRPRAWRPEEIALAESVGRQLGAAAERLRLFRDTQLHARLMGHLVSLTETLTSSLSVSEAVVAIGQGARQLSGADRVAVYIREPDGAIICPWSMGLSSEHITDVLARQRELTIGRVMAGTAPERLVLPGGRVVDPRKPFLYPDVRVLPEGELLRRVAEREGYRAVGNWPLTFEGRAIAVVSCYYDAPRTWTETEQEVFRSFCWQSAIALQNAGLREGQAQRTMELEALSDLSKRLRAARTSEEMYPIIVQQAMKVFQANHGSLALLDASGEQFTRVDTVGLPQELPGSTFPVNGSFSGRVVQSGTAEVIEDLSSRRLPEWADPSSYQTVGPLAIVPVRSEQEILGTLAIARLRKPDAPPFTDAEVRPLQAIAEMGGTAIRRARLFQNLEQSYIQMVLALARTVDARDTYTSGHSERIAVWAEAVARVLGCGAAEIQNIRWAALLHDIGKVGVPDDILRKPGSLSTAEWDVMRQHPVIGEGILVSTDRMHGVAKIVRHHQERWDGTGYPDGLRGEGIPLGARILAVVDAYSAITDNRPYKAARTHQEAIAELRRCAGTQFDPGIVEVFCQTVETSRR